MGNPLAQNLLRQGIPVTAYDVQPALQQQAAGQGIAVAESLAHLVSSTAGKRRAFWLMIPAGPAVDEVLAALCPLLSPPDLVIDGGNAHYKDSMRRASLLAEMGLGFLDCGTSGGTSGALHGACTMVGGAIAVYEPLKPVFEAISVPGGHLYCGPAGSGHFLKMVHNGIEYGMMQAMAEGFELLEASPFEYQYEQVARLFNHGSVIRGWLMELLQQAFAADAGLQGIKGVMHSSGEGRWALETALELGLPAPVTALSLMMRYRSQQPDTFSGKVVAALRQQFGGHAVEVANPA